jgi:serine/threonine protein kinase
MSDETRLYELLERLATLRERGEAPAFEDLCTDCPELLDELRRRDAALRKFDAYLGTSGTSTEDWSPRDEHECPTPVPRLTPAVSPYRPLRFHARGGIGEVFRARDERLKREVALKLIQAPQSRSPDRRLRFEREAEVTGRLEHPGIAPVYAFGECEDGRPYYAMRFIEGKDLGQAIREFHQGGDLGQRTLAFRGLLRRFVQGLEAKLSAGPKK